LPEQSKERIEHFIGDHSEMILVLPGQQVNLERDLRSERAKDDKMILRGYYPGSVGEFGLDEGLEGAPAVLMVITPVMFQLSGEPRRNHALSDKLKMGMRQRGAGGAAVIIKDTDQTKVRVLLVDSIPVPQGSADEQGLLGLMLIEGAIMPRGFNNDFMQAVTGSAL